jgi:hypothetical protein
MPPITYVRHVDENRTGEGLGSHARGSLYPLLRVALALQWQILWHHASEAFGKDNQTRPFYGDELQGLGEWMFGQDDYGDGDGVGKLVTFESLDRSRLTVVNIDLNDDVRLGRILGYAGILISSIQNFIEEHGSDAFYGVNVARNTDQRKDLLVVISLNGRFQYQDDPSPQVLRWLQNKGQQWRKWNRKVTGVGVTTVPIRVAVHIRVPEDYCSQEWKDANNISHAVQALKVLKQEWSRLLTKRQASDEQCNSSSNRKRIPYLSLHVFTEEVFSQYLEATLRREVDDLQFFPSPSDPDQSGASSIRIHRQTPLLETVQSMATADIFIPASSYLSAFAGFFHASAVASVDTIPSLIIMPEESTRRNKYFAPHLSYAPTLVAESDNSAAACPIVSTKDSNGIDDNLTSLLEYYR